MSKKLSRRDFARKSVAAGAAVALPGALMGTGSTAKAATKSTGTVARGAAAAVARRERITMPPELAYGGLGSTGRDMMLETTEQTVSYPGGWREGTTIPAEYYTDEKHYLNDERFIEDNFWLMADHENRIPKAGDYFVFEYGRGGSVIILRDRAGAVRAYHNVCRHRGSRLCQHTSDGVRPTEALPNAKPAASYLSVVQLASSGNTPVFRCPYHAWTYDLDGRLVSFPTGMPEAFKASEHGLIPAHVRTVEGFIYVSLTQQQPPDFDTFVANWRAVCEEYGTKDLKIATRLQAPTRANWKLVVENFRECYHCMPSHTKSYSAVHQLFGDGSMTASQRARIEQELASHGHALSQADRTYNTPTQQTQVRDRLVDPPAARGMGMGGGAGRHLVPGHVTGSLDGKALGPLLPKRKEWTHTSRSVTTGFSTAYIQAYDDHVVVVRFTPRNVMSTDAEIFWLVHPDAKEGKDYQVERIQALWGNTYREDRWICENNHFGVLSNAYNAKGGQPYAATEGGPAGFVKWYMREVVSSAAARRSTAG
jgi:phenylpropionate dioxygenase-like ring-hydroxylating dioxygenase large terminal subunit